MKRLQNPIREAATVAAIAAAVVMLVSPVVTGARRTAGAQRCMDNERRIGLALMRYTDDYYGCYPPNRIASPTQDIWKDSIAPLLRATPGDRSLASVFRCPENPAAWRRTGSVYGDETGRWPRSYAYNGGLLYGKYVYTGGKSDVVRRSDLLKPAQTMLVMESRNYQADLGPWMIDGLAAPDGSWSNPNVRYLDESPSSRRGVFHHHAKKMNAIMCDGHVAAVTLPQTIAAPQMWNPWQPPDAYAFKLANMLSEYK